MSKYWIEEQVIVNYEVEATDELHAKELWASGYAKQTDSVHFDLQIKEEE